MGELKGTLWKKKDEKGIIYTKIKNTGKCWYLRKDHYITKRCPKCYKDYNNPQLEYYQPNIEFCPTCVFKKGKKKSSHPLLEKKETNTHICNCPWKKFIKIDIDEENGEREKREDDGDGES